MKTLRNTLMALVVIMLSPMTANAVLIEIAGDGELAGLWEVTFVEGTFGDLADDLAAQVWWGDAAAAAVFANIIEDKEGLNSAGLSPYFVRGDNGAFTAFNSGAVFGDPGAGGFCCVSLTGRFVFAMAERVSVPEPGTLALLGLGLFGIGASRRRKA